MNSQIEKQTSPWEPTGEVSKLDRPVQEALLEEMIFELDFEEQTELLKSRRMGVVSKVQSIWETNIEVPNSLREQQEF